METFRYPAHGFFCNRMSNWIIAWKSYFDCILILDKLTIEFGDKMKNALHTINPAPANEGKPWVFLSQFFKMLIDKQ